MRIHSILFVVIVVVIVVVVTFSNDATVDISRS
jgi:hypothetical protein